MAHLAVAGIIRSMPVAGMVIFTVATGTGIMQGLKGAAGTDMVAGMDTLVPATAPAQV